MIKIKTIKASAGGRIMKLGEMKPAVTRLNNGKWRATGFDHEGLVVRVNHETRQGAVNRLMYVINGRAHLNNGPCPNGETPTPQ